MALLHDTHRSKGPRFQNRHGPLRARAGSVRRGDRLSSWFVSRGSRSRNSALLSGAPTTGIRWRANLVRSRSCGARSTRRSSRSRSRRRSRSGSPSSFLNSVRLACAHRWSFSPSSSRPFPRLFMDCGAFSCSSRSSGRSKCGCPTHCVSCRSSPGRRLASACSSAALILAIMVIPFTSSVAREVLKSVPHRAARRGVRARRDALRSDQRRALLRAHRHRRRDHARLRQSAGRDDGRDDGDWQHASSDPVVISAPAHHGGGDRQSVPRGRRRAVSARADRNWPRALHRDADCERSCRAC